jgi:hypothetical protein
MSEIIKTFSTLKEAMAYKRKQTKRYGKTTEYFVAKNIETGDYSVFKETKPVGF